MRTFSFFSPCPWVFPFFSPFFPSLPLSLSLFSFLFRTRANRCFLRAVFWNLLYICRSNECEQSCFEINSPANSSKVWKNIGSTGIFVWSKLEYRPKLFLYKIITTRAACSLALPSSSILFTRFPLYFYENSQPLIYENITVVSCGSSARFKHPRCIYPIKSGAVNSALSTTDHCVLLCKLCLSY